MNRLHHLKQTLLKNIEDNQSYNCLEFILLDYNSTDGLEDWVREYLTEFIEHGKLVYYRTSDPISWSPSHSKNMVFKLASGDILCNIWADYYTGKDFAHYVNRAFSDDPKIVLTPINFHKTNANYLPPKDVLGKVCVTKRDFEAIKGFDEKMNKHGFEDYDFVNRLEMINVRRVLIEDLSFLQFVSHSDEERFTLDIESLEGFFLHYVSPSRTEFIQLFSDQTFEKGVILNNFSTGSEKLENAFKQKRAHFEVSLIDSDQDAGTWERTKYIVVLTGVRSTVTLHQDKKSEALVDEDKNWFYKVQDLELIKEFRIFQHFFSTRVILETNLIANKPTVNDSFGIGTVYKNFQVQKPISI